DAGRFGEFLSALHRPSPEGFPRNDYRAVLLADVDDRVSQLITALDVAPAVGDLWRSAVAAPIDAPEVCVHGDLHPKNLVVERGRLAAVLDWGDMTTGD